jgi:hypothetical protein
MTKMKRSLMVSTTISVAVLALTGRNFAQNRLEGGAAEQALAASKSGTTIPMSAYSIVPTKTSGKKALTGTLAGGNPFSNPPTGSTINAVVVPVIFNIGGTIFDPTAPDSCDSGYSAVNRFNASPLVQPVPNLTFNGVNVGTAQYTDGFMRAEFRNVTGGNPAYSNPISFSTAAPVTITTGANGITSGSGCGLAGVVSQAFLDTQIASLVQTLTKSGVISTTKIALFLTNYVAISTVSPLPPPGTSTYYGYHAASGSPPQVYAFSDYPTPVGDVEIAAHQIAELMNDPLVNNATPAWGAVGIVPGCQGNLEVADPLVGNQIKKTITLNGFDYHLPEFAYFSWFFNSPSAPSLGAGGIFSSNGTFLGPSKACPPGGTY